jgi:2-polyprenyl-3-methyl-5-hydroxy-6-metoxy-1,4-benzoquinol methylase
MVHIGRFFGYLINRDVCISIYHPAFSILSIDRIPKDRFDSDHYLGRPADFTDLIVRRRVELVRQIPHFTGKDFCLADVGCGNGASMFLLASSFQECVGFDIFPENGAAFTRLQQQTGIENCHFKLIDIEKQPWPERYDRLISFEVIEHLTNDANVSRFLQLLKPGGLAAITVPNKWWIFETHGARLPLLPWNRVPFFSWLPRPLHQRWANARIYTKRRITEVLTKAGFEVLDVKYVTAPLDVLKDSRFKRWVQRRFFPNHTTPYGIKSTAIFITARRPPATADR